MKFRLAVLDGWRGLSILAVLAAHWLPLGPSSLKLNEAAGPFGMAIFFVLSGFLVTRLLLDDEDTVGFLIRRFFRIVPLAWAGMTAVAVMDTPAFGELLANFFFVANVPPVLLMPSGTHFWSLCLEIQFYLIVALLVRIFGRKALWGLPLLALLVTAHRIDYGAYVNIVTWRRADEVLCGAMLALLWDRQSWRNFAERLGLRKQYLGFFLICLGYAWSCHPAAGGVNYMRPYLGAAMVGWSLLLQSGLAVRFLESAVLAYVAKLSYAIYVIHGVLDDTWLGAGEWMERYLKRPLLFASTFLLAHLSTAYFESTFIRWGRALNARRAASRAATG